MGAIQGAVNSIIGASAHAGIGIKARGLLDKRPQQPTNTQGEAPELPVNAQKQETAAASTEDSIKRITMRPNFKFELNEDGTYNLHPGSPGANISFADVEGNADAQAALKRGISGMAVSDDIKMLNKLLRSKNTPVEVPEPTEEDIANAPAPVQTAQAKTDSFEFLKQKIVNKNKALAETKDNLSKAAQAKVEDPESDAASEAMMKGIMRKRKQQAYADKAAQERSRRIDIYEQWGERLRNPWESEEETYQKILERGQLFHPLARVYSGPHGGRGSNVWKDTTAAYLKHLGIPFDDYFKYVAKAEMGWSDQDIYTAHLPYPGAGPGLLGKALDDIERTGRFDDNLVDQGKKLFKQVFDQYNINSLGEINDAVRGPLEDIFIKIVQAIDNNDAEFFKDKFLQVDDKPLTEEEQAEYDKWEEERESDPDNIDIFSMEYAEKPKEEQKKDEEPEVKNTFDAKKYTF